MVEYHWCVTTLLCHSASVQKGAAGHDQYKAWASLLKTDYGLYMVGGSHTETSIEFNEGAVGCRVSRKR